MPPCPQLEGFDPATISVFSTRNQTSKTDQYFLDSASSVSFFFEEKAFDQAGQLVKPKHLAVNKIGHGGWAAGRRGGRMLVGGTAGPAVAGLPRLCAPLPPPCLSCMPLLTTMCRPALT